MRSSDTWVCVADGTRAQFFHCDGPGRELEPVMGFGVAGQGHAFCTRLAGQLDRAARDSCFVHLVMVGPDDTLHEIEDQMAPDTRSRVVGEVRRDLRRVSVHELECHVLDYLPH